MKLNLALLAATCFTALAACTPQAGGNNQAEPARNSAGNANAPAGGNASAGNSAAPAPTGAPVDEAFLIGRWGREGDCNQTLEFRAGGAAFPPEGSRWSMAGNVVTVTTPGGQPEPRTVARTGNDRMTVSGGEVPPLTLTRCR